MEERESDARRPQESPEGVQGAGGERPRREHGIRAGHPLSSTVHAERHRACPSVDRGRARRLHPRWHALDHHRRDAGGQDRAQGRARVQPRSDVIDDADVLLRRQLRGVAHRRCRGLVRGIPLHASCECDDCRCHPVPRPAKGIQHPQDLMEHRRHIRPCHRRHHRRRVLDASSVRLRECHTRHRMHHELGAHQGDEAQGHGRDHHIQEGHERRVRPSLPATECAHRGVLVLLLAVALGPADLRERRARRGRGGVRPPVRCERPHDRDCVSFGSLAGWRSTGARWSCSQVI